MISAQCKISLVDLSVTKHFIHTCQCFGSLCKNDNTSYRTVETMDYPTKHIARLRIFLLYPMLQGLYERLITSLVTLHNFPGSLIDYDYMIIFV